MEASEPNYVNPISNIIGVNSLWLGGLHITMHKFNDFFCLFLLKIKKIFYFWQILISILYQITNVSIKENEKIKSKIFLKTFNMFFSFFNKTIENKNKVSLFE